MRSRFECEIIVALLNDRLNKLTGQKARFACEFDNLAFKICEPTQSIGRVERIIAEGERISPDVRAVVRGRS